MKETTVVTLRTLNLVLGRDPKSTVEYYQGGKTALRYQWACGCHAICSDRMTARVCWCHEHRDLPVPDAILTDESALEEAGLRPAHKPPKG